MCSLVALIALLCLEIPAYATVYYVCSKTGSDSYNGLYPDTQSGSNGPFQTLEHAISLVSSGDTVELRAGTYSESVYGKNIGSSSNPVTIMNYNGEQVVFTSGSSSWSLYFDTCAFIIEGLNFTTGGVDLINPVNSQVLNSSFTGIIDNTPLYVENGSGVTIQGDMFQNNGYANTLVITGQSTGTVAVTGNTFQDNIDPFQESSNVLQVYNAAGSVTISGNSILNTIPPAQLAVKPPGTTTAAVMISQSSGVTIDGNTIKDFRFQGTNDCTADNPSYLKTPAQGGENGVGIDVAGSTPVDQSVIITNNTVTDCSQEGIVCGYVNNSDIKGNTVSNCGEYGIIIFGTPGDSTDVVNNTIEENLTSGNGWLHGGTSGISVIHAGPGNIIRRNFSFQNQNGTLGQVGQDWYGDGNGIISDLESNGTIIENNLSVGNQGAGIAVAAASNVVILNNTVVGNGYCPQTGGDYGIMVSGVSGPADNVTIVNNLIYNNYLTQLSFWQIQTVNAVHNNIYSIGPFTASDYQNRIIDYDALQYTLAEWQTLMSGTPNGVGSIEAVPQFAGDISQMVPDNFQLSGGPGPCDGAPLSEFTNLIGYLITWDFDGNTRNATAPTIGAFESATSLWQNAIATGNGWDYLSPFGAFNPNSSGWIYHLTLGWLYPVGTSTDSIWFYDPQWDGQGGWWWTSSSLFPWLYSVTEGEWLYYDAEAIGARWFFTSGGQASTH